MDNQEYQAQMQQAIGTLFPAFDAYVQKQTELNAQNIELRESEVRRQQQRAEKEVMEELERWLEEESRHVLACDGDSIRAVREWMAAIRSSYRRVPPGKDDNVYVKKLIVRTTTAELFREVDNFLERNGRAAVAWEAVLDHVLEAFLGPDEQEALKDEVRNLRQGAREAIPAYNRRFLHAADLAYPRPSAHQQYDLSVAYLKSLVKGRIQTRLADRDPPLQTLEQATAAAYAEWAKMRRADRILQPSRPAAPEPMEVDAITIREQLAAQERDIKALTKKLAEQELSGKEQKGNGTAGNEWRCWKCQDPGHLKKDCPILKAYWEKKGGQRRPLPEAERKLGN
jgi:hypothetical protein